jgi:predicted nuclease with TOPRIM domain
MRHNAEIYSAERKKDKEAFMEQATLLERRNEKLIDQVNILEGSFKDLRKRYDELKLLNQNYHSVCALTTPHNIVCNSYE